MAVRLIILRVTKNYYIGKNMTTNEKYKVIKNEHIRNLRKYDDYEFYCKKEKGIFRDILIPISEEEALSM